MNKVYYPLVIVLLVLLTIGCADDFERDFQFDGYTPAVVLEAKRYIESGKINVSLLDMERAYTSEAEKSGKAKTKADFSIDWGNYSVRTESGKDIVYVPITVNKKKQQAFSMLSEDGRVKGNNHQIYYALMLSSGKNGQGFDAVMITYLYGRGMTDSDIKRMGRDFEMTDYTGYYVTSCLDGTMLSGRYIENGETKFRFHQNPTPPSERRKPTHEEVDTATVHNHHHLFLNVNPLKHVKITKSGNQDMEWLISHCSICGALWDECTCVTIEDYPSCKYCHTDIQDGYCGHSCALCDVCMIGFPDHSHYGGGYSGDNNTGSGGTGGGDSGEGYTGGNNNSQPGVTTHTTTASNLTACATSVIADIQSESDEIKDSNGKLPAKCNKGVQKMFKRIFGDDALPTYMTGRANDMIRAWENHPNEWEKINRLDYESTQLWLNAIQQKANDGYFVVSGWINPEPGHSGHVTVIVPGELSEMNSSTAFGGRVPFTMDTGYGMRVEKQKISLSYSKSKIGSVVFYYYK